MSSRDGVGRFLMGGSGGPGRPKGSRNRLSESFLSALCDDFAEHGVEALRLAREADAVAYVRMCAMLMPRLIKVEEPDPYAAMSDEELEARIRELDRFIYDSRQPTLLSAGAKLDNEGCTLANRPRP